jgi:WD40 repeat protein
VKVWDAATGKETLTLKGHEHSVTTVAFSRDGGRILSSGGFERPGMGMFGMEDSSDGTVKVWDAATGQETLTFKASRGDLAARLALSPDGRRIASGSSHGTVKVWDAATGQEMLALKGHENSVTTVAFSPDGRRIVSGSEDNTVKVWDAGP